MKTLGLPTIRELRGSRFDTATSIGIFIAADASSGDGSSASYLQLYNEWPRLLSVAVRRWPEFLPAYIGRLAMHYMHSDYAEYEGKVCRKNRGLFNSAFRTLGAEDQICIRRFVLDSDHCEPILARMANP